jgi:2-polyprenyl-6-methoxyphenol hydroxylase-like FAD-dependent oxidoreductase
VTAHPDATPAHVIPAATTVLVAGGGPVGSAVAVGLALRGVACVVVERRTAINQVVKAQELSAPTMEQFARWGIADELRRRVPPLSHASIWFRGPLADPPIGEVSWVNPDLAQVAEAPHIAAQRHVNALLRERALELGVPHVLGWMLEDVEEDDDGVTAAVRPAAGGETRRVRAAYVVGADGARSRARTAAGIDLVESELLAHHFNVVVRLPDLVERLGAMPTGANMIWDPDQASMCMLLDAERGIWRQLVGPFPADADLDAIDVQALTRRIVGADVEVEVVSTSTFPIQRRIARTFARGRVLLAGDAAHLFPPFMGQNMNLGLGDAAQIGWKLAALLDGWGGPELLASYTDERRHAAVSTAEASLKAWQACCDVQAIVRDEGLPRGGGEDEAARRELLNRMYQTSYVEWNKDGVVLDQRYDESRIVVGDGTEPIPWEHTEYRPQARPGHRLPHVWLPGDAGSLYHVLGDDFTLLNIAAAPGEAEALAASARAAGVPLRTVDVTAYGLRDRYGADLVLVRPDRYVAWRGDGEPDDVDLWARVRGAEPDGDLSGETALAARRSR